ncbi:hypothetical protein HMPREF9946_02144 [Acetobacteraceae bacterium AT-5844]|nr:hypothetical protein HMPREF9946_02144 [Acetobacteraceae bacterium AT-5844]
MTPPDCDLRGYDFMPLLGHRLFSSDFDLLASDAEFRAAMRLWWASWQQCPAASLPDDERALCRLAGLGTDMRKWRKIAATSLHGFRKCADGRLYHPILAEQAKFAYAKRASERERKRRYRENKEVAPSGHAGQDADKTRNAMGTERGQARGQDADVPADRTEQDRTIGYMSDLRSDVSAPASAQDDLIEPQPVKAVAARARTQKADRGEPEGFAEFYEAYPRRDKRVAAARAFPAAVKAAGGVEALMQHLRAFEFSPEKRFVPHPATWLNERRWRDREGVAESTSPSSTAPAYDARYWDLPLEEVAMLPAPRPGSPEFNAWDYALQGMRWPRPGSRSNNL